MSTATRANRKDSGSRSIAGNTCAAITASSGRAAVQRSAVSSSSSVVTTRGRRVAVLLLDKKVFRSACVRYASSFPPRSHRGRDRTLVTVSWTRSSALSRVSHRVDAVRRSGPRYEPTASGSSRFLPEPRKASACSRLLRVKPPRICGVMHAIGQSPTRGSCLLRRGRRFESIRGLRSSSALPRFTAALARNVLGSLRFMSLLRLGRATLAVTSDYRITQRVVHHQKPRSHWSHGLRAELRIVLADRNSSEAISCDVFELVAGKIKRFDCYPSGTVIMAQLGVLGAAEAAAA